MKKKKINKRTIKVDIEEGWTHDESGLPAVKFESGGIKMFIEKELLDSGELTNNDVCQMLADQLDERELRLRKGKIDSTGSGKTIH